MSMSMRMRMRMSMSMRKKHFKYFLLRLVLVLSVVLGVSCSAFESEGPFTNKIEAPVFVSELFGSHTQTLTFSHPDGGHVSWLGFIQSNDYNYFKITKVVVGTETIVANGVEIDGETYTATSNAIIRDVALGQTISSITDFVNGNITVAGSQDLKITIEYSPLIAIGSESEPHETYLIVNYSLPKEGSMRIKLDGYTQGIKEDKCTQAISTMEAIGYNVVNNEFDLYFCSQQVAQFDQNNTPQDPNDPDYHGTSTNLETIPLPDAPITFHKVDEETVCILSEPTPAIPDFDLPIPPLGNVPIDVMPIAMVAGSFAECSLDGDGKIFCDANLQIDALVSLTGFTLTNQTITAEDLVTADCPDFGSISGSGAFGDPSLTVIFTGRTVSDTNTEEYDIVDSLILGVIELEK